MKRITISLALCALFALCSQSCKDNKEKAFDYDAEWLKNTTPEFDTERQVIYYKENMKYDIKGNIAVPYSINNTIEYKYACEFSFYNYGEDIRLFNGCNDDCFITGIGTIHYAYVLKREDKIEIASKMQNQKYGDWALVNLSIGNDYITDVFMTPLAMKAYKEGDDDSFIFMQFVSSNKYMNVLFYGGPRECIIIANCPNVILTRSEPSYNIDTPKSGPGQFWHQASDTY